MDNNSKIGLVTVLYNSAEVLEGFFESLAKQTFKNFILYVIDNSPNDNALNEAERLAIHYNITCQFVNNNANLGVAKGNNQGIELSLKDNCDYVLLLNNDIEFSENTIYDMLKYAKEKNESIIVPKIYYYGTNKLWMAGGYISKWKGTCPHRGDTEEDIGQYNQIEYINYAPTCFMLIHKDIFKIVGMMDEKYFVYYDDTDFIWRANTLGCKIVYFPKSVVNHKVSFSTGGGESSFSIYYGTRNRIYFIRKNYRMLYSIMALFYFFITRLIKLVLYGMKYKRFLFKGISDGWKISK